ncbi:polysaccharide biosynthesis C-terminal domain-containing protein [Mycolicibacterium wolinskyi]|uniref:Uncharacterized protein n=1 Tax=Mycolicibacterium wolinskyi TaxID=59750 RepID=A0A1X2FIL1_9MYCO|nr:MULTISPECIES: polysaccharide biosynthesis C-terminal domain-containing protein [Mycolicibacterium]MCV7288013.1 polysaccharide biosynthesis C-terminal domain-containing protein [Mycolicibacterium wolinskyi]MCV7296738.1 polysaccharide biosynthesis C-terminal domain-containing protein [Mycolicibacterium goodii]ORX18276.1 hypothetical protein AWC31_13185 [Mycolicibacterium wolinskyi]
MLKALGQVGGARMLATAAQAITMLIMARGLGPSSFAQFAAVLGTLMALIMIADGGATYAVGRHHESVQTVAEVFRANRLLTYGVLAISLPVLAGLAGATQSTVLAACIPLCFWAPLERQLEVISAYLIARGRQQMVGFGYFVRRMPTLAVVLVVPANTALVWAFSLSMLVAAIAARLMFARHLSGSGLALPGRALPDRATWAMLAPFWAALAGQGIRQADVAVLTISAGTPVAGIFAPASRLTPALMLVPWTYTQLLLPRLATTKERLPLVTILVVGALSGAFFVPLAITAPWWIALLLGEAYAPSTAVVRIIVVSLVFAAVASAIASGLNAVDRASLVAAVVWTSSIVTLALIATFGPLFGAVGAAWSVAFGYVLQCSLMGAAYRFKVKPASVVNV